MASERDRPTLADYIILAINPVLIMVLVGSLAFFLAEVFYAGAYGGQMRWMLFFFVMASVLITRISLLGEGGRAGLYGVVLGLLVWLSLMKFIRYPADGPVGELRGVINLFLIAVVWWCAHKLTRDCTHVADEADVGGEGLLQAAGFEASQDPQAGLPATQAPSASAGTVPALALGACVAGGPPASKGWLGRWQRYRKERKKKRTPGVWVVWFSLAALPLFGLGQSLIPVDEVGRRQYAFWLMSLYVGGGLGLLLTTSFLGLRRYLRQRKVEMPAKLTAVWLSLGGGLIAVLLLLGALLPRPQAEYPLIDFKGAGSKQAGASELAQRGEEPGEGKGQPGGDKSRPDADRGRDGDGKDQDQGKERDDQRQGKEATKDGKARAKRDDSRPRKPSGARDGSEGKGKDGQQGQDGKGEPRSSSTSSSPLLAPLASIAPVLKWIVFGLVALVALFFVLRGGLQFLANFTNWARRLLEALSNFWAALFGGRRAVKEEAAGGETTEAKPEPVRPFSWYANPFDSGAADGQSARELLRYTFAALEAWARERDLARRPDETALEFAGHVGEEVPGLAGELRRLAQLYGRCLYGAGGLPANWREVLRQFWLTLEQVTEQPLSA